MKVEDLKKVLPVAAEADTIELKEGSHYVLHIKASLDETAIKTIGESVRRAFEEMGCGKSTVMVLPCDIALYELVPQWVIVNTDNHGSDYPNEKFVGNPFNSRADAEAIQAYLNRDVNDNSSRWNKVVKMPYTLQPGFEP